MDLIQELNLHGERKGERLLSLIQQSIMKDIQEIPEDEPILSVISLACLGYEIEGDKGRMN